MRRTGWLLLVSVPIATVVVTDALRSDDPQFWLPAAMFAVAAVAAFTHFVVRPIQDRVAPPEPGPARISTRRILIGLGALALLCGAALMGVEGSIFSAPIFLALVLEAAWNGRGSA